MILTLRPRVAVCAGLVAAAMAMSYALPAQAAPSAAAASRTGWRVVFSYSAGSASYSDFFATTAISRTDAWAVGGSGLQGKGTPIAYRWGGSHWRATTLPSGLISGLNAVSAPAADDVWAVSDQGGYVLDYNGASWSVSKKFASGTGELTGVKAFSRTNVWVFGGPGFTGGFGTWHYNGHSWAQVTAATKRGIEFASALSPSNMWTVGSTSSPESSIVHYTGAWRQVRAQALSGLNFPGILALGPDNVWATASAQRNGLKAYLVHLTRGGWSRITVPWHLALFGGPTTDGHGGLWLTGAGPGATTSWAIHRSASGRWSRTRIAGSMFNVSRIPGTASVWGAGDVTKATNADAVIWAFGPV